MKISQLEVPLSRRDSFLFLGVLACVFLNTSVCHISLLVLEHSNTVEQIEINSNV